MASSGIRGVVEERRRIVSAARILDRMEQPAARYGDRHADVYDRIYGARFDPAHAVDRLVEAAAGGSVLELGLGTGRLAIPLAARGVRVDGIEASSRMIARLRAAPGGDRVGVHQVDLGDFELPVSDYAVAVCAVSTLFMLSTPTQVGCIAAAARHLRPGGTLFVEVFRPDAGRFGKDGSRTEERTSPDGSLHRVHSVHDPDAQTITISHVLGGPAGGPGEQDESTYDVTLTYATDAQLDAMARRAGLRLLHRWHDWTGAPANEQSTDPISVYRLTVGD